MKLNNNKIILAVLSVLLLMGIIATPSTVPAADSVVLHPGYLSGDVSVSGYSITQITVRAIDTNQLFSANASFSNNAGATSIHYDLVVEGDNDYNVIAEATVVATDYTRFVTDVHGLVNVPIYVNPGDDVLNFNLSTSPAFISGVINTTASGNTIENFNAYDRIYVPEFSEYFFNRTSASGLSLPGQPGTVYTLLVTPGYQSFFYSYTSVNGIQYQTTETLTAITAGSTLSRDIIIDVTAANISGTATLGGPTNLYSANVYGNASSPYRSTSTPINLQSNAYSLDVDEGTWRIRPQFNYWLSRLTGDQNLMNGLRGNLYIPYLALTVNNGDNLTANFAIDPGYITGRFSLNGANTDIYDGYIRATSTNGGLSYSYLNPGLGSDADTGKYMAVLSPGTWTQNYLYLRFDYPSDPDTTLWSQIVQYGIYSGPQAVASGQTVLLDPSFGTATVRLLYRVAGGGQLRSPRIESTISGQVNPVAYGYGSGATTTEGQAIVTLLPGTYEIEAFAIVEGSNTEFSTYLVTVDEGDVVVIGGLGNPIIQITNPTDGETIADYSVTVEGKVTDTEGIAEITINGDVVFTGDPNNPVTEVVFSHDTALPGAGANTIEVIATDTDGNSVPLLLTVYREILATPTTLYYNGDTLVPVGTPAILSAVLLDENNNPISGAEVSLSVAGQTCLAITDANGMASCEITVTSIGVHDVTAGFLGNAEHQESQDIAFLVAYDPYGGFVTGGGWIIPNGIDDALPGGAPFGSANFGFIVKYKKGATTPHGNLEFQYQEGDLNLKSTSITWMVINNNWAKFQGMATINGMGSYPFKVEARDGKLNAVKDDDRFIIKVWMNGGTTYGPMLYKASGDLQGGSIVIHQK